MTKLVDDGFYLGMFGFHKGIADNSFEPIIAIKNRGLAVAFHSNVAM